MLGADPAPDAVYFVDDHFKPYSGAAPVAKGWNTKRRHAEAGIEHTVVTDARGRAVVFDSGDPTGLAPSLPPALAQLRQVIGDQTPVLLAFDRGGAYPKVFTAARGAGADWITYRRRPLTQPTATAKLETTLRDGKQISMMLADETVELKDYGPARQLSLFEDDQLVLQVLTSDTQAAAVELVCWLRARWRIENFFKYASEHHGTDALADYLMSLKADTRKVANPARKEARSRRKTAEDQVATAERGLAQLINDDTITTQAKNAAIPEAQQHINQARGELAQTIETLKPIRAQVPANQLDPEAKLARSRIERRGLQMVLRLLAYNAEAWLAARLNAYQTGMTPDELTEMPTSRRTHPNAATHSRRYPPHHLHHQHP